MLATALAELFSTISILPFMSIAADPTLLESPYIAKIHNAFGKPEHKDFLIILGALFGILVLLSNCLLLLSQFLMNRFSFRLGRELSCRLFSYYLSKDMLFHNLTNSSQLIHRTMWDAQTLSGNLFAASLHLNGRIFSILTLTTLLLFVNLSVTMITLAVIGGGYMFIFLVIRKAIARNSKTINECDRERLRWLNEGFEGVKDIKLYTAENMFIQKFYAATRTSNRKHSDNLLLWASPYYLIETIVLFGIVFITLNFLHGTAEMTEALPSLTLFCVAGFKLIPKIQQAYNYLAQIKSSSLIYQNLYPDIASASSARHEFGKPADAMHPISSIQLSNICFSYPDASRPLFQNLSIQLRVGKITAIIGRSGCGKSTLLDILMGLIEPKSGSIIVDGKIIGKDDMHSWQSCVGYVPQLVYMTDASVAENIAFGVPTDQLDIKKVEDAARMAGIFNFIQSLPEKFATRIGERGSLISGGQRQRLGIARAFYRDISVLILDEATSALDTETQTSILSNLKSLNNPLTIVMVTHREETVLFADDVVKIENAV